MRGGVWSVSRKDVSASAAVRPMHSGVTSSMSASSFIELVEEREQDPGGVVEQRLGPLIAGGALGPATALLAVAFLGPGGLHRGQLGA